MSENISNIKDYYKKIDELKTAGGTQKETAVRYAFINMVRKYAKEQELVIVEELRQIGSRNTPDAGLQSPTGFNFGYIENKDIYDDIEIEIQEKIKKGYSLENIIFENTQWVVLYQNKERVFKGYIGTNDLLNKRIPAEEFERVIRQFVNYEPAFFKEFKTALQNFKEKVPEISSVLKNLIKEQRKSNESFISKSEIFLKDCQDAINKQVSHDDIDNMIVQHILTKDIFDSIFNDQAFHKYNSIAKSIDDITATFFTKEREMELTKSMRGSYQTIINTATAIHDHREKQSFLKTIYQEFYKAYNPSKADRQGIEYTPIEVVSFMIKMTNLLLLKHFEQRLEDEGVEILDPCTGTGIFISELLYEISHHQNFEKKFENEIFCNEIDILPYYIASLNIEYIRAQIKKDYREFKNIVLVDTLNNIASLNYGYSEKTKQHLFSEQNRKAFNENNEKIKKQNEAKLKVIIGNPPYNSNQQNENDNNKNFSYPDIDERIKETYIKKSTAQKTKQFDLYKRFIRWASDRMDEKKGGIVAFITNNAYLDSKQDDGFRACVREEFDYAYFVNLKGNSRLNGEGAKKQGENIFDIRVGVGIMFLIKNGDNYDADKKIHRCDIKCLEVDDYLKKEQKLTFLNEIKAKIKDNINLRTYNEVIGRFKKIIPSEKHQWLNQVENDWQSLVPLISKEVKNNKSDDAIFRLYSLGVVTARDKWVYDLNKKNLEKKVKKFIEIYDEELKRNKSKIEALQSLKTKVKENQEYEEKHFLAHRDWEYQLDGRIKWTDLVKNDLLKGNKFKFNKKFITTAIYRPFCKKYIYFSNDHIVHRRYQLPKIFPSEGVKNIAIAFHLRHNYQYITDKISDFAVDGGFCIIPLHTYPDGTTKMPNLTDYGRKVFEEKYGQVSDEQIFYYTYAVLNKKDYKDTYKENLKVDLPRIPLLENFHELAELGKQLADLHVGYENAPKYDLEVFEIPQKVIPEENKKALERDFKPNIYLRVNKESGEIKLDDKHIIKGIPIEAFEYKIGNKSPIEWVCSDNCFSPFKYSKKEENERLLSEIDEYNWEEVKTHLIDLIPRLVTVSLKTQEILKKPSPLTNHIFML